MLITESQMNFNRGNDSMALLDKIGYLTEAESVYAPAMVPVVENTQYQANLIRLEDMMAFAESNGIEDLGYALTLVCEASEIDPSTVAFTVQETSIIADDSISELTSQIMNEGVRIAAVPLSESDIASRLTAVAVGHLLEGNEEMFDLFCTDPVAFAESSDKLQDDLDMAWAAYADKQKDVTGRGSGKSAEEMVKKGIEKENRDIESGRAGKKAAKVLGQAPTSAKSAEQKADGLMAKLKANVNKGRDWIAKQIAALNDWSRKVMDEAKKDPANNGIWMKIKNKIAQAINWLTQRLHNTVSATRDKIQDYK